MLPVFILCEEMPMTIVQMLYFNTACQYMNLTKAAEKLHISQPALSSVIKQIEEECGVQLFRHRANSISITDEGIVLQQEIQPILDRYQHLERLLASGKLDRNYVQIGLSPFRGNAVMPDIAARFQQKYHGQQLIITEGGTPYLYENLDLNKFDLIITSKKPGFSEEDWAQSPLYGHIRLKELYMVLAVNIENPLAEKDTATWQDIVQEPLILLDNTYSQKNTISQLLAQAGYQLPDNICYANQVHTIIRFIEKNAASGFLPMDIAEENPKMKGLLFPNSDPHAIYLVWRKDRHLFHAAKHFVETARELYSNELSGN